MTPTPDRKQVSDLKAAVDLAQLFQEFGVRVVRRGRGCKALCPFHQEKTPSLSIDTQKGVYHCFGCGKSGDHLTFLQEHAGLSFPEALAQLQLVARAAPLAPQAPTPEEPFPYSLLERVAQLWQQALEQSPQALEYLKGRGLTDRSLLARVQAGYCDGQKLTETVTAEERKLLQQAGVLNERGKEFFSRCLVFPLQDRQRRTVGFYGRSILQGAKVPKRMSARSGLFRLEAAQGTDSVVLVEGVLDALALMQAGLPQVMALGGVQGLNQELLAHLQAEKISQVTLCLDGDEAGRQAAPHLTKKLQAGGLQVQVVELAQGQDPLSHPQEALHLLQAQGTAASPSPHSVSACARKYQKLSQAQGKLKVLVTVQSQEGQPAQATVDLFSSRSRRQEALLLARQLGLQVADLENWFLDILQEVQAQKDQPKSLFAKIEVEPMTPAQKAEALAFLQQGDLVESILAHMEALGYQGENEAKLLGYCVSVSRKLEKPMSAIIQSGSGAGKSYLAEVVRKLTPPEEVVFYSRLSPQALYYMPKDYLQHKFLVLEERAGGEACDYQIRALQSSGILRQAIVTKDPASGQLVPTENEVWGPMAYMETTTSLKLNPENTSRCFEIPLDESQEQTRRIHQRQKSLRSLERLEGSQREEKICLLHHHAQRLLQPIAVVIPYVHLLTFPDQWLRSRRDHDRFLTLIEVLAYLHQYQRVRKFHNDQEYLEATLDDYRWAYFLAQRVLQQSLDELSRWGRELLTAFEANSWSNITRRELRDALRWPDRRLREALEDLVDLEYLLVQKGSNNQSFFQLSPGKGSSGPAAGLMTPEELARIWKETP